MHNDLAWAVLGVDPATSAAIEAGAKQEGSSTGEFLQWLMAEAKDAAEARVDAAKRSQRLSDLISNIADSLMAAADVVKTGRSTAATVAPAYLRPERLEDEVAAQRSLPERGAPEIVATEQQDSRRPSPEQLQAWMRAADESADAPKRIRTFGRSLLRRSASSV